MGSDRRAAEWHLAHRAAERSFRDQARAALAELPAGPLPVLDLGCGSAPLAAFLEGSGHLYVGLERDPEMDRTASRRAGAPSIVRAEAERLPFPDGAFKAIVALGLFEYIPDPPSVLAEAARVAAPGGAIVLSVPRRESLYRRGLAAAAPLLRLLRRADPFDLRSGRAVTPADAAGWAAQAGLTLVTARAVAPALVPWPLDRLLRAPASVDLPESLGTAWLFRFACPPGRARSASASGGSG
ncbi:MAG: class I SAM-dependent methyltransferase [Planctomycetota bacterium]|jgi:SAM-dependent methyltransferase